MRCDRIVFFTLFSVAIALQAMTVDASTELSFRQAKQMAKVIYQDHRRTFYCDCPYDQHARRVDIGPCGYQVQYNPKRARRLEWEHIMPVSVWGQHLNCWQKPLCCPVGAGLRAGPCYKGRRCCTQIDRHFVQMESDLHNLVPEVGELNGLRSNYRFAELPHIAGRKFGRCDFKIDSERRRVEPRAAVKGMIARAYLYMIDRYEIPLSESQQQLLRAWNKQYPPDSWEIERDRRIARLQGWHNPYIIEYAR